MTPEQPPQNPEQPFRQEDKPFNPSEILSEESWSKMHEELQCAREGMFEGDEYTIDDYLESAVAMKYLHPERTAELHIDDNLYQEIRDHQEAIVGTIYEPRYWAFMKLLFGSKIVPIDLKQRWPLMKEQVEISREREMSEDEPRLGSMMWASDLNIIFPSKGNELRGDQQTWEYVKHAFEENKKMGEITETASLAYQIRLLYPKKFHELSLGGNFWREARRDTSLHDDDRFQLHLKVLAAKDVGITTEGLKIED